MGLKYFAKHIKATFDVVVCVDYLKYYGDFKSIFRITSYNVCYTKLLRIACYLAALDAGADAIDLSMAPCSGGTCQPDIVTMWHALRGSEYSLDIDIEKVLKAEEVFKDCMKDYFLPPEACAVEPTIPWNPMTGGA